MIPSDGVPGMEIVERGVADLGAGRESVDALLVEIAAPRLRAAGVSVPEIATQATYPEIRLYQLLGSQGHRDPYSLYNSLVARIVSCAHELERSALRKSRMRGTLTTREG